MKPLNILFSAILLLLLQLSLPVAEARQAGRAAVFTEIGHGARGMGFANAMTATISEGSYSFYNPAHTGFFRDPAHPTIQADFSTAIMAFDRHLHAASVRFPLPPSAGIGFSIIKAGVHGIDGRSPSGYHTGYLSTSEYLMSGSFALQVTRRLTAGVSINYFLADLHPDVPKSNTIGLNAGILYQITSSLTAGMSLHNLLASYRTDSSGLYGTDSPGRSEQIPNKWVSGLSYQPVSRITLSIDMEMQWAEYFRSSDSDGSRLSYQQLSEKYYNVKGGGSYRLHERFTFRGGFSWEMQSEYTDVTIQPAVGFSLHLPFDSLSPSVDYAFVQEPSGISSIHNFSLQFIFN
jgi:hypothetical protein